MKRFLSESIGLVSSTGDSSSMEFSSCSMDFTIDNSITNRITAISQKDRESLNAFLFTAFAILLHKYAREEEIVIENMVQAGAGSNEYKYAFINNKINEEETFKNAVSGASLQLGELSGGFNTEDSYHNIVFDTVTMPDDFSPAQEVKFGLWLSLKENPQGITGRIAFNAKLFDKDEIARFREYYANILKTVAKNPEIKLYEIDMLSEEEKQELLTAFNNTEAEYPEDKTIHRLFEEQAERTPDNIAVVYRDNKLTYKELNEKANRLARILKNKGVMPDRIVGIMAEPSIEMLVAMLAVLKAGGAYLPIDTKSPSERIQYMLQDSRAGILLTQKALPKIAFIGETIELDSEEVYSTEGGNLEHISSFKNLAYVIYTSGSTGKPKGVMIEHSSLVNLCFWHNGYYEVTEADKASKYAGVGFDASVWEIFPYLIAGASLHIISEELKLDMEGLNRYFEDNGITIGFLPTQVFEQFIRLKNKSLRRLLTGADALRYTESKNYDIYNNYGPTEYTVVTTSFKIDREYENIPIGRPISNTKVYIVDKNNNIQPIGVPGELCIAGSGISRGYLNNEELTAEKFIDNPYEPGGKMYKTGDLVRWLADGNIEFLGRIDYQVKIRGYRVELGEIESRLLKYEGVKSSVVLDKQDVQGNKYLCAYIIVERELAVPELRKSLSRSLPDYMIPSYFIQIDKMPLTPNGKIDRRVLPEPDGEIDTGVEYAAPRNEVEEKLVSIWSEVLGVGRIGIDDDFFALEGHSLKAVKMVSIIQREMAAELSVGDIFSYPTVRELGEHIGKTGAVSYMAIAPVEERALYEVSSAQKRMFALNQLAKEDTNYNLPFALLLEGKIESNKLEEAFSKLIQRHEAFRTSFELLDGEIMQRVHRTVPFKIEYAELNAELEEAREEIVSSEMEKFVKPFDLSKAPLLRVKLVKLPYLTADLVENSQIVPKQQHLLLHGFADKMENRQVLPKQQHLLLFDMHHIISDGTSMAIIMEEFTRLYKGESLEELRVQYKDYCAWKSKVLTSEAMKKHREYWIKLFSGEIPVLDLPTDYQRPTLQSFEGDNIEFTLDKGLTENLNKVCRANGVTLYMTLLAAYNVLLSKYSGQEDIIIGSAAAGRPHADLHSMVGMFVNTLAMRNYPEGKKSFAEFLQEVKRNALSAYENQDYQFDRLVEELDLRKDLSRNPLFDTILVLQNTDTRKMELEGVRIKEYEYRGKVSKFDITLEAEEKGEEISFNLEYCTRLFKRETIESLIKHYINILRSVAENSEIKLCEIDMLSEEEKRELLTAFNNTEAEYPEDKTIYELFEEQAARTPENIAVVYGDRKLTYKELNERANRLARVLNGRGVMPDGIVGIMAEPSIEMLVAMLAVLKAGGAYLPIDIKYPMERIQYMLEDSRAGILLVHQDLPGINFSGQVVELNSEEMYSTEGENLEHISSSKNLAYVIYTSGSTGKPKGVMIEHSSLVNLCFWHNRYYEVTEADKASKYAGVGFDASVWEIFPYLIEGASLYIISEELKFDMEGLNRYFEDNGITIGFLPTQVFEQFIRLKNKSLRRLLTGADALRYTESKNYDIYNNYGPTEYTVVTTSFKIDREYENIPIGRPISNTKVYIVDKNNNIQPIGVPGELCIAGSGISRGYLNNEELTAEKFTDNPYEPGGRMYKTGDLVRWLADGNIEFLGRIDYQVKIRGYRIELGEIESQLLKYERVKEAVVLDKQDVQGNKYLCAYIVAERELAVSELRKSLSSSLPDYMIPAYFIQIDKMPLTPNGKIDRRALPEPSGEMDTGVEYAAPRNEAEEKLVDIWAEVLGADKIGIDDDFFALGGHSLKAIKLASLLQRELLVEIPVSEIFNHPTVRELGEYIGRTGEVRYSSIEAVEEKELYEVSSAQKRMYALNQFSKEDTNYNIPYTLLLEGKLEIDKLEQSFRKLIERHEAFRTSFELADGEIMQRIHKTVEFQVEYDELDKDSEEAVKAEIDRFVKPFDLSKAPLLRVKLVKLSYRHADKMENHQDLPNHQHLLLVDMHHIISDGTSMSIILEEFSRLYKGESLETLRIQYKDYSVWENKLLASEAMKRHEEYWTGLFSDEVPVLDLPTDYPRPSIQSFEGDSIGFRLDRELTEKLYKVCKDNGATLYMALLSAYNILLSKYSGQEDIVVGAAAAGRPHAELHNMVGMFVNTLAMRNYPSGNKTFSAFLQEVKNNALSAYENQAYQFDMLVERLSIKRDLSRNALFNTMFVLQNTDTKEIELDSIKIKEHEYRGQVSKFDMTLEAEEKGQEIKLNLEYCTRLFKRESIQRLIQHYINILETVTENPEIGLAEIDMLSEKEKQQMLADFNNTETPYPKDKTICQVFEEQAEKTPNNTAVVYEGNKLTYRELNERANRLAAMLREKGAGPDSIVGIMTERSLEMIVGIVGIIKAGGAYLPISSDYPEDRIKYMLADSKTDIVLTQGRFTSKLNFEGTVIDLEDEKLYQYNKANPEITNNPDNLAYVIYTSGSTGNPKGVMIQHGNVINLVTALNKAIYDRYTAPLNIALVAPYVFDASVKQIFASLLGGNCLHIIPERYRTIGEKLVEYYIANSVDVSDGTPSHLKLILGGNRDRIKDIPVKHFVIGGEELPVDVVKDFFSCFDGSKQGRMPYITNIYGPTECCVDTTAFLVDGEWLDEMNSIPIGRPLANYKVYVLDKENRLQPIGVAGELCISGKGVARGYLNKPELTAEKFIANPFAPGERMYRTGDLARWLPDGNIEFLGRIDYQVKLRGYRIELGEIENQLLKAGGLRSATVLDRQDKQGNKYLCAYIAADKEIEIPELRKNLSKNLPDYMIPTFFIQIDKIPLTANGKVDRRALPEPSGEIDTGAEYVAPRNELEEKLVKLWSEVLEAGRIGINDDFFVLGGHSLKAIKLASIIQRELLVEISVTDIFSRPTVKELGEYIGKTKKAEYSTIEAAEEKELYEVASAQKRMYALNQFSRGETNYNIPYVLLIEGKLERGKVEECFRKLVERHGAFRTSFELSNDEIMQRVHSTVEFKMEYDELDADSEEAIKGEVERFVKPFDLSKAPLLRVKLVKLPYRPAETVENRQDLPGQEHLLLHGFVDKMENRQILPKQQHLLLNHQHLLMIDMHHIISDGTSMGIIMEEFSGLYKGESLKALRLQYKDYSAWENKLLESEAMKMHEEYWTKLFSDDIPVLNLPADYPRPSIQSFEGDYIRFALNRDMTQRLKQLCKDKGTTLYMALLSAYNILLSKYSGQEDIVIGAASEGRPHADLQGMVGMFVNTLAMRNYPSGNKKFEDFLQEVKNNALSAYENQAYQFDRLIEKLGIKRDLSRNPLFDTMLVLQNTGHKKMEIAGASIKEYEFRGKISKFDITLEAEEQENEISFNLEYCTRLFKQESMERLIRHYVNILKAVTEKPEIELCEIDMLSEVEKREIRSGFNATKAEYPKDKLVYELFEEQVNRTPGNIALVYDKTELTYRELNEKANSLARALRKKGVRPDSIVGIMVERSVEMMIGIMGILKAGGAYLPIDPEYPADRIEYMLEDSKADILLTQEHLLGKAAFSGTVVNLNDSELYEGAEDNLEKVNSPSDLAYVIYTSGSTGKPKGAMIAHYSLVNRLNWMQNKYPIEEEDVILQKTPITFDVSLWELFWWSMRGSKLCILAPGAHRKPEAIAEAIESNKITVMHFVPSMLNIFLEYLKLENVLDRVGALKKVFASGEALTIEQVRLFNDLFKDAPARLYNLYGPTEATVDVTYYDCPKDQEVKLVPIGKPIDNIRLYILDKYGRLQPVGVMGELFIAGDGLARGYLNREELTAERFIPNPYEPGDRMYRTGDLARWLPDGNIEFLGRTDHQVKIRGFRIELGEIENQLLKIDKIKEAVVMDRQDTQGNKYLCAYIAAEREIAVPELRKKLSQSLPDYMIPAYFIQLEKMPLTSNGKVNRKELPEPTGEINTGVEYVAARNETEEKLVSIWSEVLGIGKIGIDDDFFALGGHSLKAIKMVSIIHRELKADISVGEIFSSPTVRALGEYIGKSREAEYSPIEAVEEKELYEVSSAQKRMYALNQFSKEEINYNIPHILLIEGELKKDRVEESFRKLIERHEAFRTSFELSADEIMQRVHKGIEFKLEYDELASGSEEDIKAEVERFVRPFDLSKAPLLRGKLVKLPYLLGEQMENSQVLPKQQHLLMIDMHHIISDGTSMSIIMEEFTRLYKGESLEALRIQYKDYSAWENRQLEAEAMKKHEEYWTRSFSGEIPVLNLPTDYPRPSVQNFDGYVISFRLEAQLAGKLKEICKANGATMFMTLLSAYNVLLSKYSGQEDVVVGSPIAGRYHADLQGMVGMFVNTLAMRNHPSGNKKFREFLREVRSNALGAYENQAYQFDKLVEKLDIKRDMSRNALFDTMFILQNTDNKEIQLDNATIRKYQFEGGVAKFDITLSAEEKEEEIKLDLEYCTKLFKRETIERLIQHFINILKAVAENPETELADIDMLSAEEKRQIMVSFNETKRDYPKDKLIYELFEEQVDKTPDNVALVYEDKRLTYRELNDRANQLARVLRSKGVGPESIVGIMAERSLELLVGIMGIVKAGGVYLPISPEYPNDRIKYMLEDSKAGIILTQGQFAGKLEFDGTIINLEDQRLYQGDNTNLDKVAGPDSLIYVIYTSGSTGMPKGVMVEHRSVVNILSQLQQEYPLGEKDAYMLKTNYVFDVSVSEIFGWFFEGGRLVILKKGAEADTGKILHTIERNGVTHINFVPSMLRMFVSHENDEELKAVNKLKYVFAAGEAISESLVQDTLGLNSGFRLENLYGPTEATVYATKYPLVHRNYEGNVPIGKPVANTRVYVVDKNNKLQPIGVAGELCIAGHGLARGYLNRPELTADRFIADLFEPGERMYKTGDLVRWQPDGNIEYIGRIDHQVKIRGYRIELGEIESCLLKLEDVTEAVVIDREEKGSKYLCAYLVSETPYTAAKLREELKKSLPDYMIPSYFVTLAEMPLNQNGKLDRKVLPLPDGSIETGVEYASPGNEAEERLVAIWHEVLGADRIGINDDFFALGGHSLKAIKLASILQREFMVEISVSEIFTHPTVAALAEYIGKTKTSEYFRIEAAEEKELYQVSSAQRRMYALNQFSKEETNYNIPLVMLLEGELERGRVEESFRKLIERYEAFRTSFEMAADEIMQRVHRNVEFEMEYDELDADSEEAIKVEVERFIKPFDLSKAPLLRVKLVKLPYRSAEQMENSQGLPKQQHLLPHRHADKMENQQVLLNHQHLLMIDIHHIISDGTSMGIILEEFTRLYNGESLETLRIQYKDYSEWESSQLASEAMKKHEEYWTGIFRGEIPVLNLPTDYTRPSMQSFEGASIRFLLDKDMTQGLKEICRANGATLYMALLSAYNVLLSKYTGQEDIVVGSPIAGRPHADLQRVLGMFANTLAMRNYPERNKTFTGFLQEVKKNALGAYENQDFPFDRLVEKLNIKRDLSRNAIFDTMLVLQNTDAKEIELDNITVREYRLEREVSKFDMTLSAEEQGSEIKFKLEYCTRLFERQTMERLVEHFKNIIKAVAENPELKLDEIDMISESEKQQLLADFNNTATPYPEEKTICQAFEEQVENTPDNLAVAYEGRSLTYRELNEKANQLAAVLRGKGVGPDSIVGIMAERSIEMLVGIVGIIKAGGAYLPIAPDYPEDRIIYMLGDSETDILLTQQQYLDTVNFGGTVIDIEDEQIYRGSKDNPAIINGPSDLAYVIYTSGSTGKPKGVMIRHGNVINLVTALNKAIYDRYTAPLNIALIAPYVFDASVKQIFACLLGGNCLHIIPEEYRNIGEKLVEYYIDNSIDVSDGTPSHFKLILSDNRERIKDIPVRHFIIGGEELPVDVVKDFFSFFKGNKPVITNIYGPTECCVDTTAFLVDGERLDDMNSIPIGSPLANYRVYVLDKENKLQPIGVAGELCISGKGVARGYLNRPELTAEKFVDNPFVPGDRMYRTGDLVRWLPDGNIEFLGRIDHQVKIRGYRIEIGEIEAAIKSHPSVQDTVVIVHNDSTGEKRLVAYVVPEADQDEKYNESELKEYLKKRLPKYMVPAVFTQLENIPLNTNGKVDRFALPEPDMQRSLDESYMAPRNKEEMEMAEIWSKTLGIERIGIDDDFFDLGGDSLKAIKLVRRISSSLGVMELFKNSTVRELAAYLSEDVTAKRTMLNELTKPVSEKDRVVSVICFPYGGGSAISYQPLANVMPRNYSLYSVELPGHDYSCPDEELASIEESAARCLEEILQNIKGPVVLYGHCLGATMAALVAYKLEEAGIQLDGVIVGAMFPAARISNRFFKLWDKIFPSQANDKGNRDLLRMIGGLNSDISPDETKFILRNLKHDSNESIRWFTEFYNNEEVKRFKAPMTCIVGEGDRLTEFYQERYKEWERFSENVELKTIRNAGHFFFKNQAVELRDIIKEKIDMWQGRTTEAVEDKTGAESSERRERTEAPAKKQVAPSMNLFLIVAAAQIISQIGTILSTFGTGIWIFQQTNVLSQFAMMFLFSVLPAILLLPISGAVVDRFNRRLILIASDALSAICSFGLLILLYNNGLQIWHVYVFTIATSAANCFRQPAYMAAITQIAPKMYLAQANSVSQFSAAIGSILASICGGVLIGHIGFKGLVTIDFATFIISFITLMLLRFPDTMFTRLEEPIMKELMGGWNFIMKRKSLVAMVVFFLLTNFLISIFDVTITPLILSFTEPAVLGVINAFSGVGILCGAIGMLITGGTRKRAKGMVGFVIPLAVSIIIASLRPLPAFAAMALFGASLSVTVVNIHWQSLIQVKVGLELQGRVFAVNRMLVVVLTPISYITAGILADRVFAPIVQYGIFNSPIVSLVLGTGAGRGMRLVLLLAGTILLVWGILGVRYKKLSEMDDLLEDASQGEIVIRDKDKLQEIYDGRIKAGM